MLAAASSGARQDGSGSEAMSELASRIPSVDAMASDAVASALGVVEKIDFDSLTFNTDDE